MDEIDGYSPEDQGGEEADNSVSLVEVREHWQEAQDLPFAFQDEENIITEDSLYDWWKQLSRAMEIGYTSKALRDKLDGIVLRSELLEYYKQLRFLSRANAQASLGAITGDIQQNFDPTSSLVLLEPGSGRFFYEQAADDLKGYGTVKWSNEKKGIEIVDPGQYEGDDPQEANKLLYIDDWVLSGTQLMDHVIPTISSKDQLFTYHMVMSDRGKYIYDKSGLNGKCVYKIDGDDSAQSIFGSYPLYGFHKVPDVIFDIYAPSAKSHDPAYSIFPPINGDPVGGHSRLVRY